MTHRLVLYNATEILKHAELAAQLEAAGFSRKAMAATARRQAVVYLNRLEPERAEELAAAVRAAGFEAEAEPMALDPERAGWLERESAKWVRRGAVYPMQRQTLLADYGIAAGAVPGAAGKSRRSLIGSILAIGSVLIGLGIILLIASNWQRIPAPVKILSCQALTLTFLGLGYFFRYHAPAKTRLDSVFLLLSIFGIGGCIILIGQIYHVLASSHVLPFVWGALALPLAFAFRFRPAFYFTGGLWLLGHLLYFSLYETTWWTTLVLVSLGFVPWALWRDRGPFLRFQIIFLLIAAALAAGVREVGAVSWIVATLAGVAYFRRKPSDDFILIAAGILWFMAAASHMKYIPNLAYLIPLGYFSWRAWKTKRNGLAVANVWNALFWWGLTMGQLESRFGWEAKPLELGLCVLAVSLLFYGAGQRISGASGWTGLSTALMRMGLLFGTAVIYVLSFRFYASDARFFYSPLALAWTSVFAAAGITLALRAGVSELASDERRWDELGVLLLAGLGFFLTVAGTPAAWLHPVIFNLVLFFQALVFLAKGYRERRISFYQCGIALFVVLMVSRYFDTFWAFLPRSAFFIAGGAFLILWALFIDRQKKRLAEDVA